VLRSPFFYKKICLKGSERLAKSCFAHNYCHVCHSRFAVFTANTDSSWIHGKNYRYLTGTNSRYYGISLLRTYRHLSRSRQHTFNQRLLTFRQNYLKLYFIPSSFSLCLRSATLVEKGTYFWFQFNMILLTNYRAYLQKTVKMYIMYINWISSTVLYGFCVTSNFSVTVVVNKREMQLLFCYDLFRLQKKFWCSLYARPGQGGVVGYQYTHYFAPKIPIYHKIVKCVILNT